MNFAKFIIAHIFAVFKYFSKQTIYFDSQDDVLQNDITTCLNFKSLNFFRTSRNGINWTVLRKLPIKSQNQNILWISKMDWTRR